MEDDSLCVSFLGLTRVDDGAAADAVADDSLCVSCSGLPGADDGAAVAAENGSSDESQLLSCLHPRKCRKVGPSHASSSSDAGSSTWLEPVFVSGRRVAWNVFDLRPVFKYMERFVDAALEIKKSDRKLNWKASRRMSLSAMLLSVLFRAGYDKGNQQCAHNLRICTCFQNFLGIRQQNLQHNPLCITSASPSAKPTLLLTKASPACR